MLESYIPQTFPIQAFKSFRLVLNITAKNQNWQIAHKNAVDVYSLPGKMKPQNLRGCGNRNT